MCGGIAIKTNTRSKNKTSKNIQAILQAKERYLNRFFKISYNQGFKNNPKKSLNMLEKLIERVLFATRWLLAPLCIAMSLVLVVLGYVFMKELWHMLSHLDTISETDLVLSALGLVDLLFMAGLVLMVLLASYESFVSKLDKVDASEITWLKHTDFNALKLKVSLSIVAISAIFLLKRYMSLEDVLSSIPKDTPLSHNPIFWQVVIHLVFVCSALLTAVTNNIAFSQKERH